MDILGVLNFILSVIIGLLILVALVVVHELGHGIVARRNGVVVEEFGVGFPPFAWGKKIKESILGKNVLYSLNWLPLGGFVKLQGEHDAAKGKGDYGAASLWAKTKILLAGVVMNWLVAVVLLAILAGTSGVPKLLPNQFKMDNTTVQTHPVLVSAVTPDSPAAKAGLKQGDRIVSVAGTTVESSMDLSRLTKQHAGTTVELTTERNGARSTKQVALNPDNASSKGYLGVAGGQKGPTTYQYGWGAPIAGVALTGQFTGFTLSSLGDMFVKFVTGLVEKISFDGAQREAGTAKLDEVSNNVGGPIAILGILFPSAREAGISALLLSAALISLTLAVMNALPIPALDGGRWFVTMLYRVVLRKPLTKEKEEKIHGTGMMVLLGLFVLVTISDIWKLV